MYHLALATVMYIKRNLSKRTLQTKRDPSKRFGDDGDMCRCAGSVFDVPLGVWHAYTFKKNLQKKPTRVERDPPKSPD